jgi:hypothetical protein
VVAKIPEVIVSAHDAVDLFPTDDKKPVCLVILEDASQFISAASTLRFPE